MRNQVAGKFAGEKGITVVQLKKYKVWQTGWEDYRTCWNEHHRQGGRVQLEKLYKTKKMLRKQIEKNVK